MAEHRLLSKALGHGERITMLTDQEFRVWIQYQLSADDFGIMRFNGLKLQADHEALAKRELASVQASFQALIACGLLMTFDHQERPFVCQADWQKFQKMQFASQTTNPKPPQSLLDRCQVSTKHLFSIHPGGKLPYLKGISDLHEYSPEFYSNLENSQCFIRTERSVTANANANANANAKDLVLGKGGVGEKPSAFRVGENGHAQDLPPDEAWAIWLKAYPGAQRSAGFMENQSFLQVCDEIGLRALLAKLEAQKISRQWREGFVPSMRNYFRDKLWVQDPDEKPQSDKALALEHLKKIDARRSEGRDR